MKFKKYGKHQPDAIEFSTEEIQPLEFVQLSHYPRLNYLIGFIQERKPEKVAQYIEALEKGYSALSKIDYSKEHSFQITNILDEYEHLKDNQQLAIAVLNYYLQILNFPEETNWLNEKVKPTDRNYLRSFLSARYHNVSFLAEVLGKEEAVKLYKIYRTLYAIEANPEYNDKMKDIDYFSKENFKGVREEKYLGNVVVLGDPENGKMYYRKDTCFWARSIEDLPDSDFRYLAACYSDFEGAKIHWNQHFILTMDHTIAKGDPYCSCIIHDTRVDWNLTHPPKEFWDKISPLGKWQKEKK